MSLRREVYQVVGCTGINRESPVLVYKIEIACITTVSSLPVLCLRVALITHLAFGEGEFTKFIEEIRQTHG